MGFPMRCDFPRLWRCCEILYPFQSLMGFPMRCDGCEKMTGWRDYFFQSLMGFPMRCDQRPFQERPTISFSFNPLWVFQCAATRCCPGLRCRLDWLSIPYGFSNALRPYDQSVESAINQTFNPLWVFQCAATRIKFFSLSEHNFFQSLMGFPMRCDGVGGYVLVIVGVIFQSLMGFPMRCD